MADKELEVVKLPAQEIFQVGTWNGDRYELSDLQAMVDAFDSVGFKPAVKLGHQDKQEQLKADEYKKIFGAPSLGFVERIYIDGGKLLADIANVPKHLAALISKKAFSRVSAEIFWNYAHEAAGKTLPRVLKAISFLGVDIPAVTSLADLSALYQKTDGGALYAYDENKNEYRVYCGPDCEHCKGEMKEGYSMDENNLLNKIKEMFSDFKAQFKAEFKAPEITVHNHIESEETKEETVMDEKQIQAMRDSIKAEIEKDFAAKLEAQTKDYESKLAAEKDATVSALKEENDKLRERTVKLEQAKEDLEINTWMSEQKKAGKLLPVEEKRVFQLLRAVKGMPKLVKFSEGEKEIEETPEEALRNSIEARKPHNFFKEFSKDGVEPTSPSYTGERADVELDRRAKHYMNEKSEKNYKAAVSAVLKSDPDLNDRYEKLSRAN